MANPSKDKGDRFERESVPVVVKLLPEFALEKAMRYLGAGRIEDVGDLYVLPDAGIQVKAWDNMGGAIRTAVAGSVIQAGHGPRNTRSAWSPSSGRVPTRCARWPVPVEPVAEFKLVSRALAWVKEDKGPYGYRVWDRLERVGFLGGPGVPALIAPIEAWAAAYRQACGSALQLVA